VEPIEAIAADQLTDLAGWLPPRPARILDVGCGRGALAQALAGLGYAVTAIDVNPEAVAATAGRGVAAVRADIADYDGGRFDAVVCSLSLHHVEHLAASAARLRDRLRPGGSLIVDEFAWERADRAAATWFYDTAAVLAAAGVLDPRHDIAHDIALDGGPAGADAADPLESWLRRHRDEHGLHSGAAVVAAIGACFEIGAESRAPYLYRYLGGLFTGGDAARGAFGTLRRIERLRVADGTLPAVGLRLVAHPR
jgi:SAM-dependent methyltransferase